MKYILLILVLVCASYSLQAQNKDLSFEEIDSLGKVAFEAGNYEAWQAAIHQALDKAELLYGKVDSTYAFYLVDLGHYYIRTHKYKEALSVLNEALDIQQDIVGTVHPAIARTYNHLGGLYSEQNKHERAIYYYQKANEIRKETVGENSADYAESLHNLAAVYNEMGDVKSALPIYLEALAILKNVNGEVSRSVGITTLNIATVYHSMENYDQAIAYALKGKDIIAEVAGEDHLSYSYPLNNLAGIYMDLGKYEEALSLFKQGNAIIAKTLGEKHSNYGITINNIATVYYKMGKLEDAINYYKKAMAIYEQVLGKENLYIAATLNNLAASYDDLGKYEESIEATQRSRDIYAKYYGTDHPEYAIATQNLARVYFLIGEYDKVDPLIKQAAQIRQLHYPKDHPTLAETANLLAGLYSKQENYEKAQEIIREALNDLLASNFQYPVDKSWEKKFEQLQLKSNRHLNLSVVLLESLYSFFEEMPQSQEIVNQQIEVASLATFILEKFQNSVSDDRDKLRMLKKSNTWLRRSLSVLDPAKDVVQAFQLADQNKSVLLLKATQSESAYHLGELPDSLVWQNKQLLKKRSQLQAKLLENHSAVKQDSLLNVLNNTNQELAQFVEMLRAQHPKYYAINYQKTEKSVKEIQQQLRSGTALIEYAISKSTLHIFCITSEAATWMRQPLNADSLASRISTFHKVLSNYREIDGNESAIADYQQQAFWFYEQLVAPVLAKEASIQKLIIVPDGEIAHLPFESFISSVSREVKRFSELPYLLKSYSISYNYSATLWHENVSRPKKDQGKRKILAFASSYPNELNTELLKSRGPTYRWAREALGPLPAARAEVQALQSQFAGYFAFDSLANERLFKEKAGDYAIIHLAMHGLLNEKRPILSSLAFTEDGDSSENNFLQAYEISKMELNADLVVLSACETGYGRFETGNGIASLARSFMYAGVPALVVSLWQVNDQSTSTIMQNFYANLAKGLDKAEALRKAKLDYLANVENPVAGHPAFWSPFILIGDESPIQLQKKEGAIPWWGWALAGGLLVLVAGGMWSWRARRAIS